MTREWSFFWGAIAVMSSAMAATVYASLGRPWALGSVADWIAGTATLAAVVVALRTARRQGELALQVSKEEREEREVGRLRDEIRLAKSMIFVAEYGRVSLEMLTDIAMGNSAMARVARVISPMEISRITARSLQGFISNHAPTTRLLQAVIEVEACFGVAVNCADLRVQLQNPDADESWRLAMQQLDDACGRLAKSCVASGARPTLSDSVHVQRRLGLAMQT